MGRGRAKAKQTKVARELKYSTGGTDLERLQRELASGGGLPSTTPRAAPTDLEVDDEDEYEDPYADDDND